MNRQLSIRVRAGRPNHHLWNNNGTWFIHYTVHGPDFTKSRVRQSLGTKSIRAARQLRDHRLYGRRGSIRSMSMRRGAK